MDVNTKSEDEIFLTDFQLRVRWGCCSAMKLWRLRRAGKLKSRKVGNTNLTSLSDVKALEGGANVPSAA
jgi:hypothetical protein